MLFPIEYIPYVNTFLVVIFLILMIVGLVRGFLLSLMDLIGTFALLFIAYFVSPILSMSFSIANKFEIDLGVEALNKIIVERIDQLFWFVVIFVVGQIALIIIKSLVKVVASIPIIKQCNQLLGLFLGAIKGYLLSLVIIFVLSTPLVYNGRVVVEQSWLSQIEQSSGFILHTLENPKEVNETLQNLLNGNMIEEEDKEAFMAWLTKTIQDKEVLKDILSLLNKE